jgi:putative DNA-invertase from lambdoid prophage Rac
MTQRACLYARVSTADQDCSRQVRDLEAFAARVGHDVVATFRETASGTDEDRPEWKR